MYCVYVLKNLKSKKLCIGLSDDFKSEFSKNPNSVLVSIKMYKDKKEAGKSEKYLKSKKGLAEFRAKIKKRTLGIMN